MARDLEIGNAAAEERRSIANNEKEVELDEYSNLVRYISTYRDTKAGVAVVEEQEDYDDKKRPWYAFWRKETGPAGAIDIPADWLETDINFGLTNDEVERRRRKTGFNELADIKENMFLKFIGFFRGPILYVMEVAVLLAAGLRAWIDFGVIIAILLLNAVVGWYQEKQAADVVASLKGDIAMKATVVRDGIEQEILAREIVPGDIVVLEGGGHGTVVPGDCRLICAYDNKENGFADYQAEMRAQGLVGKKANHSEDDEEEGLPHGGHALVAIDQSSMTGESLAVEKYVTDVCYYTTGCKRGKAYAIITCSAKGSFVGKTASLVSGAQDTGHFKAIMNSIGAALLVLVMAFILAAWIGGFYRGLQIATPEHSSNNILHYALILLIVGVPVGLPVVTTTTLAVGAAYLAKEKAIVQKLTAIESLAGVDILCSDKTGTLTANQLSIREPYVADGVDIDWMMAVAALASSHNTKHLDPIDKVTIITLKRYPRAKEMLKDGWKTHSFTPFDPVSKRITTVCEKNGIVYTCAKGAPKAILAMSNCSKAVADEYRQKALEFAHRGFRSLGVAVKEGEGEWQLLGMLSLFDPPREDTAQTIADAQHLGLQVKMLTGDALAIAKETCRMLALGTKVYDSDKLVNGGLTGSTMHDLCEKADGFAEVFPEHKYQVVEMLQQRGHLTAMTGDGVNDAPSLKKSDCGIAVEGATEAAQAAADIVFLAPGLSTIVSAIKISRQIFQRMKAYIQYRIALCLHLEIYLVTSMIILKETIRAELIVFIALFADLATIAVAYDNAHFEKRPVEWQLPKIWFISVILGSLLAIGTWAIRGTLFLPNGGIIQRFGSVQEILFLEVSLTENWLIFITRGFETIPSWQLVLAILGVDALATIFCIFGWLSGGLEEAVVGDFSHFRGDGWTDVVTVICVWLYSMAVTVVIAIVYYMLTNWTWLDNLGRKSRSIQDTQIENIISHLSKIALEHDKEKDSWQIKAKSDELDQEED